MAEAFVKDPHAVLDYAIDWTDWLNGDTITSHTVTLTQPVGDPSPLTVDSTTLDGARVIVWLSGGNHRTTVPMLCRITTAGGRTDDRTTLITIMER